MAKLDPPIFIATDAQERLMRAIETFERETARDLKPAQPERLTLNAMAYELNLHAIQVQEAMRQGLVDFARFPMLDYLGRFYGITRLPPSSAKTTLRVTIAPRERSFTLPLGAAVAVGDSVFATDFDLLIPPNGMSGEVTATAAVPGPSGNGFAPGQIDRLLAPIAGVAVVNITPSAGGGDIEDDEALRLRILEAPEKMTVAGSKGAYIQRVREVSPTIVAVGVASPRPGDIDIAFLTRDGPPSPELIAQVQAHLSDRLVRPMGDAVTVKPPRRIAYRIDAEVILTQEADAETTLAACRKAAWDFATALRWQLGRDIVPRQIVRALMIPGIHDLILHSPSAIVAKPDDWPDCEAIALTPSGRADD